MYLSVLPKAAYISVYISPEILQTHIRHLCFFPTHARQFETNGDQTRCTQLKVLSGKEEGDNRYKTQLNDPSGSGLFF